MKAIKPGKADLRLIQPTESLIAKVKADTGIFIALAEALSFQMEKIRSYTVGPDRQQLNNLKGHLDGVVNKHRAAEKKANPGGYDRYDVAFDESAATIIELITALKNGEVRIEETTTDKAA